MKPESTSTERPPLTVDEIRAAVSDESSPLFLSGDERQGVLRQMVGSATANERILSALRDAVEFELRLRDMRARTQQGGAES